MRALACRPLLFSRVSCEAPVSLPARSGYRSALPHRQRAPSTGTGADSVMHFKAGGTQATGERSMVHAP
ncbi:hypothetical protein AAFF_G00086590 [Aldrovandia affinis]|uniref:Uncharacterized protein n=1 Tax=Aldrovandia affinis TaxID=143900 RepID=A0AAD7WD93_9TELE|nr:hypothetical protein AAFF_G00086590 [Aldrovandia affinis]